MKSGDLVTVSARAGTVAAVVLDVRCIEDLPDLPCVDAAAARAILLADAFRRAAIIGYEYVDDCRKIPLMFVALEDGAGLWWDLKGNNLQLDPRKDS
jgi:hypothetical protein